MKIEVILAIIVIHWVADFVCQTSWQAENKSKQWGALLEHTLDYSLVWFCVSFFYGLETNYDFKILLLSPITFIFHTATDYYTSRLNAKLWEEKKVHQFFVSIGFDQVLHYFQLFLTFYFLTK